MAPTVPQNRKAPRAPDLLARLGVREHTVASLAPVAMIRLLSGRPSMRACLAGDAATNAADMAALESAMDETASLSTWRLRNARDLAGAVADVIVLCEAAHPGRARLARAVATGAHELGDNALRAAKDAETTLAVWSAGGWASCPPSGIGEAPTFSPDGGRDGRPPGADRLVVMCSNRGPAPARCVVLNALARWYGDGSNVELPRARPAGLGCGLAMVWRVVSALMIATGPTGTTTIAATLPTARNRRWLSRRRPRSLILDLRDDDTNDDGRARDSA